MFVVISQFITLKKNKEIAKVIHFYISVYICQKNALHLSKLEPEMSLSTFAI